MKKTFLLIATLAGLASTASAASSAPESPILILPAYVVTAPRELPAEQRINASLAELRKSAKPQVKITPEFKFAKRADPVSAKIVQIAAITVGTNT